MNIDAIINLQAVFQEPHRDIEVANIHPLLQPSKDLYGLKDYEKVYSAKSAEGCFYEKRGVDKEEGGIIIVRPDQYVAEILPLDDYQSVANFFEKILIEAL
ncbi:hypothetical protein [Marinomonas primoryensis]|uniref:hypothetical protein n=1 Tax=Marinomonas primoryensis TaxID=178399 RepID=UPI0023B8757F|nr:hypothetical protein [Marinomonas primoryensis]